jgi:Tol biopolymer transport system component
MREHPLLCVMVFLLIGCSQLSQRVTPATLNAPTQPSISTGTPAPLRVTPGISTNIPNSTTLIINSELPAMRFLISPDADSIALCTYKAAVIWNVNLENGHRQQISEEWGCNKLYAWRPQSQQIFYLRETPSGTGAGAIVSVDANTSQVEVIVPERVDFFALSPDGRYIAYTLEDAHRTWTLWIMELVTSHAKQVASGQIGQLFWSTDSTQLLYGMSTEQESQLPPTGGYLLTYQMASGKQQHITPEFKHLGGALWSPDSQWVAFASAEEPDQDLQVYLVMANGSELRTAGAETGFSFPIAWSPQGDSLLYINRLPGNETGDGLWRHYMNSGANTLFAQGNFSNAVYSPDGKKIAVMQQNNRLGIIPAEGGAELNIAEKVAESDKSPSFQWLSATELAYLRLEGAIQIQSVP